MSLKIPDTTKDMWLPALENDGADKLQQAIGHLYDGHGYCCLGVFAKVAGCTTERAPNDIEEDDEGNDKEVESEEYAVLDPGTHATGSYGNINESELLLQDWADQFGLSKQHQNFLSHLNDGNNINLPKDDPMYPIAVAIVAAGNGVDVGNALSGWNFKFKRHTFAEIAQVIRTHF